MVMTLLGIVTLVRPEPKNERRNANVRDAVGIVTLVRPKQFAKRLIAMVVTLLGIVTLVIVVLR